jgi:hypothetical protein
MASAFLFINIAYAWLLFSISSCSLKQLFYIDRVTYILYEIVATIICPSDSFRTALSFYFFPLFHGKWANCLLQNKRHFFILLCSVARTLRETIANTFGLLTAERWLTWIKMLCQLPCFSPCVSMCVVQSASNICLFYEWKCTERKC